MADDETQEETTEELPPEQEERIVDKVVSKVKAVVADLFPPPDTSDPEQVEHEAEGLPKEPTTIKEIESDMEAQVRAALSKIGAEKEHEEQHKKLAQETERTPVRVGKVTNFLWGPGDEK